MPTEKPNLKTKLNDIVKRIKKDTEVIGIILFGSYVRNKDCARDIDVCVMLDFKEYSVSYLGKKRLDYLNYTPDCVDIQIFQLLPIYIRIRVLREGKFLFIRNQKKAYDIAYDTLKEYNLFEPHYLDYIKAEI